MIGPVNQPSVGDLTTLTTTAKTSAVAAINEVDALIGAAASASGSIGVSVDTDGTLKAGAVDVAAVIADGIITEAKLSPAVQDKLQSRSNMYSILEPPAAFAALGWTPLTIYQEADGRPSLGGISLLDIAPYGAGVWYVDIARPDNSGDGLSWATAEKSINYAVQDANASVDGGTIWIADGVYPYGNFLSLDPSKNIAIRALHPGSVIFSNHREFTWALDGVLTNTYTVTHGIGAAHYDVRDALYLNALGDYQQLVKRASAADVDANAGSWYDSGTVLYVRLSDSRAPDANVRPYWGGAGSTTAVLDAGAGSVSVLFDGIRFEGGSVCVKIQAASAAVYPTAYFIDCTFKYAFTDALNNVGADTYCQRCLAACNLADGFHYAERATAVRQARFFEYDCVGRDNGDNVDGIDNGSTGHNVSLGIRLACNYYHNWGRNLHDVGTGASWNIGCWSHDSRHVANDIDIGCGTSGGAVTTMWLDHCRTGGSAYDLEAYDGCTIYTRYCTLGTGANTGAGTIAAY